MEDEILQEQKENNDELIQETLQELCHLIIKEGSEEFLADFAKCIFTSAELKDFANRWLLVKEIEKGTTQREIAKKFGMSLCKITRGSRELAKEDSAFRKMLNLLESEQKK